jgi:hypothetical protein
MSDEEIIAKCQPYTMTSLQRQIQTIRTIEHVISNKIDGDIVEIGVWRGGTVMIMLYKLMQLGVNDRHVHLYDTFTGMTEASEHDVEAPTGRHANEVWERVQCVADYNDVYTNITSVGYPMDKIHFHVGDIRQVEMNDIPATISLLRLDNDWFELYKFELPIFAPRVSKNGIITIDDYGHWNGCKKAVDDYIQATYPEKQLYKIDYTGVFWMV